MDILKIIKEELENISSNNIYYHGSETTKIIKNFNKNLWITQNETIAASYAYNKGGYCYEFKLKKPLNYFEIKEKPENQERSNNGKGFLISGSDKVLYKLFYNLYGKDSAEFYKNKGVSMGLGNIINNNPEPIVNYVKKLGYNSIKFKDIDFSHRITDYTYIIFDTSILEVINIYDIDMDGYEFEFNKINSI